MKSADYAIEIIPELSIDSKYASIISEAMTRIEAFTNNAVKGNRVSELFEIQKLGLEESQASRILNAKGRLVVGFQFEGRSDNQEDNFSVFVKKLMENGGKSVKFSLSPTVQEIMLQLISLEDRRTVAIFSMLNSSMDIGYRILTTLYGNQLKRLLGQAPIFLKEEITSKLERLKLADSPEDESVWKKDPSKQRQRVSGAPEGNRPGAQENILQVMADDSTFNELNQYVENVQSRAQHIREKRKRLEENPDFPKDRLYEEMVREDLDQLENCYARIHIYLKAFYKKKDKRTTARNKILRQFFGAQIEKIFGETSLLEDLLSLDENAYFKNLERHNEL
jgi:hypothetical protein